MVDAVLDFISTHRQWAFLLAFLCALAETLVVFSAMVPASAILLGAGALTATGVLDLAPLVWGGFLGSIVGSTISWWAGLAYGPAMLRRRRVRKRVGNTRRVRLWLQRWGAPAVALGHGTGPFRAVAFAMAGLARVPLWQFLPMTALGAAGWAVAIPMAGAMGGSGIDLLWQRLF
jgi:membrane protein DedA with SNARE-associated domain